MLENIKKTLWLFKNFTYICIVIKNFKTMANAMQEILSTSLPYNRNNLIDKINKLNVTQKGLTVHTSYDNKSIKTANVSEKYHTFDFPEFVKTIIPEVENYFTPSNYFLRIIGGRQEIKLIGEEVQINNETFYRMLSILNSTDKSKALQMNLGLLRLVCLNGSMVSVPDESISFKVKHFENALTSKLDIFNNALKNFQQITNAQKDALVNLQNQKVSYTKLANALVRNEDNEIVDSKLKKLTRFTNKLLNSYTDRLDNITNEQHKILSNPTIILQENTPFDIELDKYTVYNCYTELYRSKDSAKIKHECDRILKLCKIATI